MPYFVIGKYFYFSKWSFVIQDKLRQMKTNFIRSVLFYLPIITNCKAVNLKFVNNEKYLNTGVVK